MIYLYKTQEDTRIYIYSFEKQAWIYAFPDMENLLKFLACRLRYSCSKEGFKCIYLDNINCTGNDTSVYKEYKWMKNEDGNYHYVVNEHVQIREYMFVDAYERILDLRQEYNKIKEYAKSESCWDYSCIPQPSWQKKNYRYQPPLPEYRREPVPYTGHLGRWIGFRHPKTFQEMKLNTDPEYAEFVRPKRRKQHLPQVYDDIYRPRSKCWKDCSKRKTQWKIKNDSNNSSHFFIGPFGFRARLYNTPPLGGMRFFSTTYDK